MPKLQVSLSLLFPEIATLITQLPRDDFISSRVEFMAASLTCRAGPGEAQGKSARKGGRPVSPPLELTALEGHRRLLAPLSTSRVETHRLLQEVKRMAGKYSSHFLRFAFLSEFP